MHSFVIDMLVINLLKLENTYRLSNEYVYISTLPMLHLWPPYGLEHKQLYVLLLKSIHVPLWWQGLDLQLSKAGRKEQISVMHHYNTQVYINNIHWFTIFKIILPCLIGPCFSIYIIMLITFYSLVNNFFLIVDIHGDTII